MYQKWWVKSKGSKYVGKRRKGVDLWDEREGIYYELQSLYLSVTKDQTEMNERRRLGQIIQVF